MNDASSCPVWMPASSVSSSYSSEDSVASFFSAGRCSAAAVSSSALTVSTPPGSWVGLVRPRRNPGIVITLYQGIVLRSCANLLLGLYASTSGDEAKSAYHETQSPFFAPISVVSTAGEALTNTSATMTLFLMSAASVDEPCDVSTSVCA